MSLDRRTRKAWLLALAVVAAVVLWLLGPETRPKHEPVVSLKRSARTAAAGAAESPGVPTSSIASGLPRRALGSDESELCGVGVVKRSEVKRPDFLAQHFPALETRGTQWIDNMRASNDEVVRAAGHYVAATVSWAPPDPGLLERIQACGFDQRCAMRQLQDLLRDAEIRDPEATREIDALVDQAVATNDPFVYATAYQACHRADATGERGARCQRITLDRWTQLDADNMIPWLFRASDAQLQGDIASRDAALYRASIASTSRIAGEELLSRTLDSMPNDLGEFERRRLQTDAAGVAAAWILPPFQTITGYCNANAILDANTRQVCDGLATVLAERSNTLIERAISIRLAERLEWPPERIAAMRKEKDAMFQVTSTLQPTDAMDCESLRRENEVFSRRLRMGELAFAQALVEESKQTVDALAGQYAKTMAAFASASAASAPVSPAAESVDTGMR